MEGSLTLDGASRSGTDLFPSKLGFVWLLLPLEMVSNSTLALEVNSEFDVIGLYLF
jgi:hypothetical protein